MTPPAADNVLEINNIEVVYNKAVPVSYTHLTLPTNREV